MASFRILNPFQVFLNADATAPAKGGRFEFFEAGTTDPKSVFGDPALTIDNGSTVTLGPDGRLTVDTWGGGAYRVRQYDVNGSLVQEADNVRGDGGAGASIPPFEADSFLTNDGAILLWEAIRQLPDMLGQGDKFLSNDGAVPIWKPISIPQPVAPDIVLSGTGASGIFRIGTAAVNKKGIILFGSDTMPASGQIQASGSFTFPGGFSFDEPPRVFAIATTSAATSQGDIPKCAVVGTETTGFAVSMSTTFGQNAARISSPVPFNFFAFGFKTITP